MRVVKLLALALLLALPINLAKHFESKASYVNGLLVDYLIPAVYLIDVLCVVFLVVAVFVLRPNFAKFKFFIWFGFVALLTASVSTRSVPSLSAAAHLILYILTAIYLRSVFEQKILTKNEVIKIAYFHLVTSGALGLAQFILQRSVFSNYLILGEQPYTSGTYGIALENFFDRAVVPPYGLFTHPNILAGFLGALILLIVVYDAGFLKSKIKLAVLSISVFTFLMCFSYLTLIFLILALALIKFPKFAYAAVILLPILLTSAQLIITSPTNISIYRRNAFAIAATQVFINKPFFGTGYFSYTIESQKYLQPKTLSDYKFIQPAHNVFLLLASETGLIGVGLLVFGLLQVVAKAKPRCLPLFVFFAGILSVDHFVLTSPQFNLFFWTLLFGCVYNLHTYEKPLPN